MQIKHVLKPYKPIISTNESSNSVDEDKHSPSLNSTVEQFCIDLRDLNFIPPNTNKWIQLVGDSSEKDNEKYLKKLSEITYQYQIDVFYLMKTLFIYYLPVYLLEKHGNMCSILYRL